MHEDLSRRRGNIEVIVNQAAHQLAVIFLKLARQTASEHIEYLLQFLLGEQLLYVFSCIVIKI